MADMKKATKRVLDMGKAGERGEFRTGRVPRGSYRAKVTKVTETTSKAGNDQWVFSVELAHPDFRRVFPYYCGFEENALWKIRNLLTAAGKVVPSKKVSVDPTVIVGKFVGIELDDDEYDGKEKSVIIDIFPVKELATRQSGDVEEDLDEDDDTEDDDAEDVEDEEEDEEPAPPPPPKKKKKKQRPVQVDEDDLEELDVEDL